MVINQRLPLRNQVFYSSALPNNFPVVLCHTFLKKVILFIYFWVCLVFVAAWAFLQLWGAEATLQLQCTGFSLRWLLLLRSTGNRTCGFSSCNSQFLKHSLNSCGSWAQLLCSLWSLPGSGTEPVSPALPGGFFTTEPPGQPQVIHLILPN